MTPTEIGALLRKLPQVDRLVNSAAVETLIDTHSRSLVLSECRALLDSLRANALAGEIAADELSEDSIIAQLGARLSQRQMPYHRRVINATGVVLHTGLGRAPLADEVTDALVEQLRHPVRVEIDLESGLRGSRDEGCAQLLKELTGAEDATIVNNNAGATLLLLSALAEDKEVLVSHGELVEIGGSFRIPDIMEQGGARLKAVGTTNRTRASDYDKACSSDSAMVLKVHTSNYRVVGFTEEAEIGELCDIGKKHKVPVVHDMGSGCMVDLASRGLRGESWVRDSLESGCALVCFSGDKLLGGPQAGIIAGSAELVQKCRKHPLYRAMRPGRMTYIALEQTLRVYLRGEEESIQAIPSLRRVLESEEVLTERQQLLLKELDSLTDLVVQPLDHDGYAGSGSLPARPIASKGVQITTSRMPVQELARLLRTGEPAILPTVQDDAVILDVRTIEKTEIAEIAARVAEIVGS
ncbi:MAG: L-seryl-tRNA(Sec) selenium transferase [Planctomycetia bacterium TMED53]|nr:MAG: L-seryl-tRNA(Sec) selenium transferase [Planctomycetia bacterium TMED53]